MPDTHAEEASGEGHEPAVSHAAIGAALRQVRQQVRWRPGKAQAHLAKRVALGHLPVQATLATYEALIQTVVQTPTAVVWVYHWGVDTYPTVVAEVAGVLWLVMCGLDGVMETAFPPEDPATYLAHAPFTCLGTIEELGV